MMDDLNIDEGQVILRTVTVSIIILLIAADEIL